MIVTAVAVAPGTTAVAAADGYAGAIRPATATGTSLDVEEALTEARRTGQSVEATAAGTSSSVVTALPNGQIRLTQHATATRKRVDGAWKALDATLARQPNGTITSSVTTNEVKLSPGGDAPLATLVSGDRVFTVAAPMPLPPPALSGDTATYRNVLPDVDLVATASRNGGFSHVFVVHTPEAAADPALATLELDTQATGFTLDVDAAGNIAGRDRSGATVLSAPAPLMWDSSSGPVTKPAARGGLSSSSTAMPGRAARTAPIKVRLQGRQLRLTPDQDLLTSAKTTYPVYIDPTFTWSPAGSSRGGWASISYQHQSTNYWMNTPDPYDRMQVGNSGVQRSNTLINFTVPISTLTNAEINSAYFKITNTRSYSCDDKQVNVYAPDTVLSSSNATWNYWEGQSSGPLAASKSFAYGYTGCGANGVSFDVKTQIQRDVSSSHKTRTLWMKAANEASDAESWKEFLETSPTLEIEYNHKPNKPAGLTTSPKTACTGGSTVGDASVSLYAPVSDRNGGVLGVSFRVTRKSDGAVVATSNPNLLTSASGATSVLVVPQATLRQYAGYTGPGTGSVTAFTWRVQATDFRTPSDWSDTCTFNFDPTRPGHPEVSKPQGAILGQPTTFTITAAGGTTPSGYLYQLNAGAPVQVPNAGAGGTTVSILPTRYTNTLTVTSLSPGGNIGDSESVTFNADPTITAADGDMTGDDVPDLLATGSVNGLPPGLWLTEGGSDGPAAPATNIGAKGNGLTKPGSSKDYNGAQAITGQFSGYALQDVLVYYPSGPFAGGGTVLRTNGDGSVIQPSADDTQYTIQREDLIDESGQSPLQVASAGDARHTGSSRHDLIGISGNNLGYYLTYYPSVAPGAFQQVTRTSATTPDGSTDWNNWTIATAQTTTSTGTSTAMFLWEPSTGALHLWTDLSIDIDSGQMTYTPYTIAAADWNKTAAVRLRAADITNDGLPDLWTIGDGGVTKVWRMTSLAGTTGTITADTDRGILTPNHAWHLGEATEGPVSSLPAEDAVGTLAATGSGAATWHSGDLFDPSIDLDGLNSTLTTPSSAVPTNGEFSLSVWAKPDATGGTVLSQDGVNTAGFRLWAEASDNSWRFAMSRSDVVSPAWDTISSGANTVRLGVWTELTITYKPASGNLSSMYLYINGRNVGSAAHSTTWNADRSMRFGSTRTGTSTIGSYFNGQLSTIQTWTSVALNPTPAPHDLTGDGKPDLVTADSSGNLHLRANTGGTGMATFGAPVKIGNGWGSLRWDIHDWTQDGLADVMMVDTTGNLWAYPNVNGAPSSGRRKQLGVGWNDYTHASANANTSPRPDHFGIKNSTGELFYYPNGCCKVQVDDAGWSNHRIYPADFNRDGLDDLIAIDPAGYMWYYPNTGQAGHAMLGTRKQIGVGWDSLRVAIADINSDGLPDAVAAASTGQAWVYPGMSTINWGTRFQVASDWNATVVKNIG
ncbi:FG-GAP-like repeat-containing protein [Micromonospora sp. RP3T]|uniref:FG-GAP-like repeat-containing protein n=1 Tax=Micromonospora sp. RP3T TaxID=2135446 RepID=UPI0011B1CE70|nr:FG-GAP-like repeat-containing protein [Micromonospora sp. RP3T]